MVRRQACNGEADDRGATHDMTAGDPLTGKASGAAAVPASPTSAASNVSVGTDAGAGAGGSTPASDSASAAPIGKSDGPPEGSDHDVLMAELETYGVGRLYDELRRLAAGYLRRERDGHTLQATALVNEAFLRLMETGRVQFSDRDHYMAVAARTMRRVLVDHARARRTEKRGGGVCLAPLTPDLDAAASPSGEAAVSVMELDAALEALAAHNERAARVIELRVFGSLTVEQLARVMHVSRKTAAADLRYGRAWLARALERGDFAA